MKPYGKYKDSGVTWLGKVPEHWEIRKTKYLWKENIVLNESEDEQLLSVSQYTGVNVCKENSRSESLISYKKVCKHDLVINIMLAWLGGLGVSDANGVVSPAYCVYRLVEEQSVYYLNYLYRTKTYLVEFARNSKGVVPSRWRMYTEDFGRILTLLPPMNEQQNIVAYLDRKCNLIDKAISQKEQMIGLLTELKQFMIQKVILRGLDPKVKLRDSGVDWIGEIPEHWEIKRLKYVAFLRSGETISPDAFKDDGIYPVYGGNGFRGFTNTFTNEGLYVLIGRQGALCGNINYANGKFYASEHAIVVYPLHNENVYWLGEIMKIADFNRFSQSAAQPGIAVSVIKNINFPYPPLSEQQQIAEYIDQQSEPIDRAISLKRREIELLKEYRTTLIDSVVTGKVKVEME